MKSGLCFIFLIFLVGCSQSEDPAANQNQDNSKGNQYQIGSSWDRFVIDQSLLDQKANKSLSVLSQATARYRSIDGAGTVFYIGKHNGKYLVATNKHVVTEKIMGPLSTVCSPVKDYFVQFGKIIFNPSFEKTESDIQCVGVVGMWDTIDFAILEIKDFSDSKYLDGLIPMKFSTLHRVVRGTEFISVGYGVFNNANNLDQKGILGSACRLFSEDSKTTSDLNNQISTWSIATNCDASPGDSGSALADMKIPGVVYGVIWAAGSGSVDKTDDEYIEKIFQNPQDPQIWEILSSAVTSNKILEALDTWLQDIQVPSEESKTIEAFLKSQN